MKITKVGDNMVVTIPLKQKENNGYMDEKDLGEVDNLIGIIAGDQYSISQLNDLSYKGDQQEGMPILMFNDREDLEKACKECEILIWEHPTCVYCGKALRGTFTVGFKGNMCDDCCIKEPLKTHE
jgi:hypothetical protein